MFRTVINEIPVILRNVQKVYYNSNKRNISFVKTIFDFFQTTVIKESAKNYATEATIEVKVSKFLSFI